MAKSKPINEKEKPMTTLNLEITLIEVENALKNSLPHLNNIVVDSAYITGFELNGKSIEIKGVVIYEYEDEDIGEYIAMIYEFEKQISHNHIVFIKPVDCTEGGFDTFEEAEQHLPNNKIKID